MISKAERRFTEYWLEQKSGPRWKYYLQFTIAWTVVSFLIIFFLAKAFTNAWEMGGPKIIFLFISVAAIIGFLSTHLTYIFNEKKYKKIIKRNEEKK